MYRSIRNNWFIRNWSSRVLFRTAVTLAVLVILHTMLLYFEYSGLELSKWLLIWLNLLSEYAGVGIIALGMTFVIACGCIDLSAGAMAAVLSSVTIRFADIGSTGIKQAAGLSGITAYIAAIFVCIILGALMGQITGLLITRLNAPSYVVTFGIMMIFSGLSDYLTADVSLVIRSGFMRIALYKISGIVFLPVIYWLVLAITLYILFRNTVFGKYVIAIGSSEKAARLAGINVERIKRAVFMLAGMMTAVTAAVQAAASAAPDYTGLGSNCTTDAIAACVLGGARLDGGRGYVAGTVMGTLIIAIINNISGLTDISPYIREACKGVVIIGAIMLQKKNGRPQLT